MKERKIIEKKKNLDLNLLQASGEERFPKARTSC